MPLGPVDQAAAGQTCTRQWGNACMHRSCALLTAKWRTSSFSDHEGSDSLWSTALWQTSPNVCSPLLMRRRSFDMLIVARGRESQPRSQTPPARGVLGPALAPNAPPQLHITAAQLDETDKLSFLPCACAAPRSGPPSTEPCPREQTRPCARALCQQPSNASAKHARLHLAGTGGLSRFSRVCPDDRSG